MRDELESWVARHVKLMNNSEVANNFKGVRVPIKEELSLNSNSNSNETRKGKEKEYKKDNLRRLMQDNAKLKRLLLINESV